MTYTASATDSNGRPNAVMPVALIGAGGVTPPNQTITDPGFVTTSGGIQTVAAVLTRPANVIAYSQYDLIADSVSAAAATPFPNAVRAAGEGFRAERFRLRSNNPLAKGISIRGHVWRLNPTLSVQDNAIFNTGGLDTLGVADITGHVGAFDVTLTYAGAAGAQGIGVPLVGPAITIVPSTGTTLYVVYELRTVTGYTPLSGETFSGTFEGIWS